MKISVLDGMDEIFKPSTFSVSQLPPIDRAEIERGNCPWCLVKVNDGKLLGKGDVDICPKCNDEFSQ